MTRDEDEAIRRILVPLVNEGVQQMKDPRAELESAHGQVWDIQELQRDYTVSGFRAPFVEVTRKSDGAHGLLMFSHSPRFYFGFVEC